MKEILLDTLASISTELMNRQKNKTEERHTDLICISLVTHPVAHNEEDDKSEHRGHDNPSNDNHNSAAKKLGLHEMASQVLWLCGEVDTAYHPGGGQRGHLVIIDGQHTEVVVGTRRQVVYQDAFTGRWYHPVSRQSFVTSDIEKGGLNERRQKQIRLSSLLFCRDEMT